MRLLIPTLSLFLLSFFPVSAQKRLADSLLVVLANNSEDTNKVNTLRMLCGAYRLTDPDKGIAYGRQAVELAEKLRFTKGLAGTYLNIGVNYIDKQKLDSAILSFDKALVYARQVADPNRLALIYLNIADVQLQLGNLAQSIHYCDSSLSYAEIADNDDRRARVYQTIGSVYYKQDNYDESVRHYEVAMKLYRKINNPRMESLVLNNLGNIYKRQNEYKKALTNFTSAIRIADSIGDLGTLPLFLNNITDVYVDMGELVPAKDYAARSLHAAQQSKSDYYVSIANAHFADIYLKEQKFDLAVSSALTAFDIARKVESMDWQQTTSDLLADAYAGNGNFEKAYEYSILSKELSDSLASHKYTEDVARLQTAFKVTEKDKEILLLNNEAALKRSELAQQRIYIFATLVLIILSLIGVALLINRNKLKHRMKEMELRNRIAADLHDEVGSSLSSIHLLSHMAKTNENGRLTETLHKINRSSRETMERMSDIVWAIQPGNDSMEQLVFHMKEFAADILDPLDIQYEFDIRDDLQTMKLGINQRRDLYLIFKEAVNNAAKYSGCKNMKIVLDQLDGKIQLLIGDDGIGFQPAEATSGNGLNNMNQRAKQMGGCLEIISAPGDGSTVRLELAT